MILQILLQGFATGALWGMAAQGMSIILHSGGFVHMAVGHVLVIAGIVASLSMQAWAGSGSLVVLLVVPTALGVFTHWIHRKLPWKRFLGEKGQGGFFLFTLGGVMVLEFLGQRLWPLPTGPKEIAVFSLGWGLFLSLWSALGICVSIITSVALWTLLRRTRLGFALRAWERGTGEIALIGVDPKWLGRWSCTVGCGVLCLGGAIAGTTQTLTVQEGIFWTTGALCLAVWAGSLRPVRANLLGWSLGIGQGVISMLFGPQWHPIVGPLLLPFALWLRSKRGR